LTGTKIPLLLVTAKSRAMKNPLCLLLLFSATLLFSQKKERIDSLKKLGRDSLVKLAVKKLKDPAFDPELYDRISVKAYPASLLVSFEVSVLIYSESSCYYKAVYIPLVGDGIGRTIRGKCADPEFYRPSPGDKKKIKFIFDAINKSNEVGDVPDNKLDPGTFMEISELPHHYYVEVSSWGSFSFYKVDKATGKISGAGHEHLYHSVETEDRFELVE
jgi:hypothetical protein